jgi:hypothetical protein
MSSKLVVLILIALALLVQPVEASKRKPPVDREKPVQQIGTGEFRFYAWEFDPPVCCPGYIGGNPLHFIKGRAYTMQLVDVTQPLRRIKLNMSTPTSPPWSEVFLHNYSIWTPPNDPDAYVHCRSSGALHDCQGELGGGVYDVTFTARCPAVAYPGSYTITGEGWAFGANLSGPPTHTFSYQYGCYNS